MIESKTNAYQTIKIRQEPIIFSKPEFKYLHRRISTINREMPFPIDLSIIERVTIKNTKAKTTRILFTKISM